jgi:hypothetical protein
METYCVKCKKQTKFEAKQIVTITKNNRRGYFSIHIINKMCKDRQYDILLEFDPNNYKKMIN